VRFQTFHSPARISPVLQSPDPQAVSAFLYAVWMITDRYFKVVPEPVATEPVPIVASFATQAEADVDAYRRTRRSGVEHIVAYHPTSDLVPLSSTDRR